MRSVAPRIKNLSPSLWKLSINLEGYYLTIDAHFLELIRNFLIDRDLFFPLVMRPVKASDLRTKNLAECSESEQANEVEEVVQAEALRLKLQ